MKKRQGLRILMLLENNPYPQDSRVRKEANSLTEAGYAVTVICPRKAGQPRREVINGVSVSRFPAPTGGEGFIGYLWEYGFSMLAMLVLSWGVLLRGGFDTVHAHNPPDTLVVIGLFYKLLGKKFVFDHHDLSPELFAARFGREEGGTVIRVLRFFEKLSCKAADLVIVTNDSYKEIDMARGGVPGDRIVIVRNGPSEKFMKGHDPDPELARSASTILGYIGVTGYQDGIDYFIRALSHLVLDLNVTDVRAVIIGDGDALDSLKALTTELILDDYVWFAGWQEGDRLLELLSTADICVAPEPSNPYTNRSTMIKLMEYMSLGKPIVAFNLNEHRNTAQDAALYADPNDELDFARKIAYLIDNPANREELGQAGRKRIEEQLAWPHQARQLIDGYQTAIAKRKRNQV
ncbi:MAG: glycosyltransferase family 4 protein [Anaerolineae bacterium]|nr:glycosyltransferase family 4 protein [Anaerolineae bacterium]